MSPREAASRRRHALRKTRSLEAKQGPFHFYYFRWDEPIDCVAAALERVIAENA